MIKLRRLFWGGGVIVGLGAILLAALLVFFMGERGLEPYVWSLPKGFPEPTVPAHNPMSAAKVELGRHLFYDTRLSGNGLQSCATCHQQKLGFTDGVSQPIGSTGEQVPRNSMSLINVAYSRHFTWAHNGLGSLEQQILIPLFGENPVEMGVTGAQETVLAALSADLDYPRLFDAAFRGKNTLTMDNAVKALAAFVRSLVSFDSRFDRYAYLGDDGALTAVELQGLDLFMSERLECHHCHSGFNFSETSQHANQKGEMSSFHVTGFTYTLDSTEGPVDRGLYNITLLHEHKDRFKTPSLRNVAVTAPYMHDGSLKTLEEVVELYSAGGRDASAEGFGDGRLHPYKSMFIKGFSLTQEEKAALIAFLHTLTDESALNYSDWSNPLQ